MRTEAVFLLALLAAAPALGAQPADGASAAAPPGAPPLAEATSAWTVREGSSVKFTARITGGSFVAESRHLRGKASSAKEGLVFSDAEIFVNASSLKTGLELRDEHLRDKYLEAERFPAIAFTTRAQSVAAKMGGSATVDGEMTVKGVKRPLRANVTFEKLTADRMMAVTSFKLDITEFGIPRPGHAVVRMDPVIDLTVTLILERRR